MGLDIKGLSKNYAKENDEMVFLHRWFSSMDSEDFSLSEDYYLIRNGIVLAIQEYGTDHALYPTGDKVLDGLQCVKIGKYSAKKHEAGEYKRKLGWFNVESIRPVLKDNHRDI